jgi:hypothetical protein
MAGPLKDVRACLLPWHRRADYSRHWSTNDSRNRGANNSWHRSSHNPRHWSADNSWNRCTNYTWHRRAHNSRHRGSNNRHRRRRSSDGTVRQDSLGRYRFQTHGAGQNQHGKHYDFQTPNTHDPLRVVGKLHGGVYKRSSAVKGGKSGMCAQKVHTPPSPVCQRLFELSEAKVTFRSESGQCYESTVCQNGGCSFRHICLAPFRAPFAGICLDY